MREILKLKRGILEWHFFLSFFVATDASCSSQEEDMKVEKEAEEVEEWVNEEIIEGGRKKSDHPFFLFTLRVSKSPHFDQSFCQPSPPSGWREE